MLKKQFMYYAIIWTILLCIFLAVWFLTPDELLGFQKYGGAFWGPLVIILISYIGELLASKKFFDSGTKEELFLNLPVYRIAYSGMIFVFVMGTLCMAIPDFPNWLGALLSFAVFAFTVISVSRAAGTAERINEKEEQLATSTSTMKGLILQAKLMQQNAIGDAAASVKKVYEALQYSDIVSNAKTAGYERTIQDGLREMQNALDVNDTDKLISLSESVLKTISTRNNVAKSNK